MRFTYRHCWSRFWPTSCPHLLCVGEWLPAVSPSSASTHGAPSVSSPISSLSFWVCCLFCSTYQYSRLSVLFWVYRCLPSPLTYLIPVILGMLSVLWTYQYICCTVLGIPVLTEPPHLSHPCHSGYAVCFVDLPVYLLYCFGYTSAHRAPSPISSLSFWVCCLFCGPTSISVVLFWVYQCSPSMLNHSTAGILGVF